MLDISNGLADCLGPNCSKLASRKLPHFFHCKHCRILFNQKAESCDYEEDYFFVEYERQYGRSYVKDKANIQKKMIWRLRLLAQAGQKLRKIPQRYLQLLEIGSACGFFLELASKSGYKALGWEVSRSMARYANDRGYPTETGDLAALYQKWRANPQKFDVIAAFYVIEHLKEPFSFWEMAQKMLRPGGFLALALPSTCGPDFYFNRKGWLAKHPTDHFVDYSPRSLKRLGQIYSFRTLSIHSEGIHPERFPLGNLPILKKIYQTFQKRFAFSDTMFAILRKI